MDKDGKLLLEKEVESIIQAIPEWAKAIPQNDEIRKQISAIYHAIYGYAVNGMIANDYLQKINSAVEEYNIFSGEILGWAFHSKDDYTLSDFWDERNKIISVKEKISSMIANIKLKKRRKHKHGKGDVKEAYDIFVRIRGNDVPSFRQFQNWVAGNNVPKGFPGIDSRMNFMRWCNDWDKPEKKNTKSPIGGMTEEEIYRKRQE